MCGEHRDRRDPRDQVRTWTEILVRAALGCRNGGLLRRESCRRVRIAVAADYPGQLRSKQTDFQDGCSDPARPCDRPHGSRSPIGQTVIVRWAVARLVYFVKVRKITPTAPPVSRWRATTNNTSRSPGAFASQ